MKITVSGEKKEVKDGLTLPELIELENVARIFFVPEKRPAADVFVIFGNVLRVIYHADGAEGIRNGKLFIGVVIKPLEAAIDVFVIFYTFLGVVISDKSFGSKSCRHIVRGDDDIIADGAA